jgi:hypothetical protein
MFIGCLFVSNYRHKIKLKFKLVGENGCTVDFSK